MSMAISSESGDNFSWRPHASRPTVKLRGPVALGLILAVHVVLIVALLNGSQSAKILREAAPIVMMNLNPVQPPREIVARVEVKLPKSELPKLTVPIVETPEIPPPVHSITLPTPTAKQVTETERPSPPPTPPVQTAPSPDSFEARLLGHLDRYKHYPPQARARGDKGTAFVRFALDRDGSVSAVELVTSSGSRLLDQEAVALISRAAPLPKIPDDLHRSSLVIVVPIRFFI